MVMVNLGTIKNFMLLLKIKNMNKTILVALTAVLGVVAGALIEKRTHWFDHLMMENQNQGEDSNLEKSLNNDKNTSKEKSIAQKKNFEKIESQVNAGGGLTDEGATGNND